MNQGLIPIISKAVGIDVDDFGVLLEPPTVGNIREKIQQVSETDLNVTKEKSFKAHNIIKEKYSEECFYSNFKIALESILKGCNAIN